MSYSNRGIEGQPQNYTDASTHERVKVRVIAPDGSFVEELDRDIFIDANGDRTVRYVRYKKAVYKLRKKHGFDNVIVIAV